VGEWRESALAWLAADESRRLPFGDGGPIAVLRESVRIKMASAGD
jgi:hypothetical protein